MVKHLFISQSAAAARRGRSASQPDAMPRIRWYA